MQAALLKNIEFVIGLIRKLVQYDDEGLYKEVETQLGLSATHLPELFQRLSMVQDMFKPEGLYELRVKEFDAVWKAILFKTCFGQTVGGGNNQESLDRSALELASLYTPEGEKSRASVRQEFAFQALFYCMHPEVLERDEDPMSGFARLRTTGSL